MSLIVQHFTVEAEEYLKGDDTLRTKLVGSFVFQFQNIL
jgi:hypothetical protein